MNESMHRDHDLDLISALAEGRLSDPEPARRLIASCPECAELYEDHVLVLRAVEGEPKPRLDDLERARLHNSLWKEIGASAPPARTRPAIPWWYRLGAAAAVLVVVVGLATALNNIGLSGDAGGETAETLSAASDTEAADEATEMAPMADSPTAEEEAVESTEAPATTAAMDGGERDDTAEAGGTDLAGRLEAPLQEFRQRVVDGHRSTAENTGEDGFECDPPARAGELLAVEEAMVNNEELWFAAYGDPEAVGPVVAYRRSDCEIVLVDR